MPWFLETALNILCWLPLSAYNLQLIILTNEINLTVVIPVQCYCMWLFDAGIKGFFIGLYNNTLNILDKELSLHGQRVDNSLCTGKHQLWHLAIFWGVSPFNADLLHVWHNYWWILYILYMYYAHKVTEMQIFPLVTERGLIFFILRFTFKW